VALTLTPALCAIMLRNNHGKAKKKTPINRFVDGFITRLTLLKVNIKIYLEKL
jgi:HAE1 family hydrophobic/amphiphilic exporter-1